MSQYDITFKTFAEHPRKVDEFKKDYYDRISGIVGKASLTIRDHYTRSLMVSDALPTIPLILS